MIRKLANADKETVLELLNRQPAENLFIIGDIEAYGFDDPVTLWGDFNGDGQLVAVLMRYFNHFIPYAPSLEKLDAEGWGRIINLDGRMRQLSGLDMLVRQVMPYIWQPLKTKQTCCYAQREAALPLNGQGQQKDVRMLFPEEADKMVRLRASIPAFHALSEDHHLLQRNMEKGISRSFYVEKDDRAISAASTSAETRSAAMIVGVCTLPDYQRQGLATSCLIKILAALRAEHKTACLFYDNPDAGRIYEKLGFQSIGHWIVARYG